MSEVLTETLPKRKPGRPKGSKNKSGTKAEAMRSKIEAAIGILSGEIEPSANVVAALDILKK